MSRCPSTHDGLQCGMDAGHGGSHSALVPTDAKWNHTPDKAAVDRRMTLPRSDQRELREDALLTAKDIAERLHISRSMFYTIGFFRERAIRVGTRSMRWHPEAVSLYLAKQEGRVA